MSWFGSEKDITDGIIYTPKVKGCGCLTVKEQFLDLFERDMSKRNNAQH